MPRHHAVAHLDHRELDATREQRVEDDAADEARAHQQHPGARLGVRLDRARIGQRPARVHARAVESGDRQSDRRRAGGDQQPVVRDAAAVFEHHLALADVDLLGAAALERDAELAVVVGTVPQVRAGLLDLAAQQIGDRHARVRRLGLVADDRDGVAWRLLAQRLGRDDTGRPGAQDYMLHACPPEHEQGGPRTALRRVNVEAARAAPVVTTPGARASRA
jgi:hypothetical protein